MEGMFGEVWSKEELNIYPKVFNLCQKRFCEKQYLQFIFLVNFGEAVSVKKIGIMCTFTFGVIHEVRMLRFCNFRPAPPARGHTLLNYFSRKQKFCMANIHARMGLVVAANNVLHF